MTPLEELAAILEEFAAEYSRGGCDVENPALDAIRDKADGPWNRLTPGERGRLQEMFAERIKKDEAEHAKRKS